MQKQLLAFFKPNYIRDAQAYLDTCLEPDTSLTCDEKWQDINAPMLVLNRNITKSEALEQLQTVYPGVSPNAFSFMEIHNITDMGEPNINNTKSMLANFFEKHNIMITEGTITDLANVVNDIKQP